jgi:hypothetical protein
VNDHLPDCACCGGSTDPVDLDIRSALPDPVLALPAERREELGDQRSLLRLDDLGAFIRCLMPVRLSAGSMITYSAWLQVDPASERQARKVWNEPAYAELRLEGTIANAIKPWGQISGEPARAEVRDTGILPYLVAEPGTLLERVLTETWDRDDVLSRIWYPLPTAVRQQITAEWSLERTAGLAPERSDDYLSFRGPGRTVHLSAYGVPAELSLEQAIARMTEGAPPERTGELTEQDGQLLRHAFWRPAYTQGKVLQNLHGFIAAPGAVLHVGCVYDDPADLAWAQRVWRSAKRTA